MKTQTFTKLVLILGVVLLCQAAPDVSYSRVGTGDDAVVLPKGFTRLFLDSQFYIPFDQRYNRDGDVEALGADFNTSLDSRVFSALTPLNPFVGGNAKIGNSNVIWERELQQFLFQPAYGLTERLTIGMNIPYVRVRNNINANVDSSAASGANVGKNPAFACGAAICPLVVPGTMRLSTEDVQNLLGAGLDVNGDGTIDVAGQGLKRVETWEGEGVGDIEVGGRYQYFRSDLFRAAFTGGARLPTGRVDDPDNLVDTGWGTGAYALLFQFNQDLMFQREGLGKRLGFPSPGDFFFNTTFRYDLNLPDRQDLRVCSPRAPVCTARDNVKRDLGDVVDAEISGKFGVLVNGLIFSALYRYGHKFEDHNSGSKGLDYGSLAIDSERTEHIYIFGLTYSTVPLVGEKKFPFPFAASVSFRDRFAGTNNVKSQYIGVTLQAFF